MWKNKYKYNRKIILCHRSDRFPHRSHADFSDISSIQINFDLEILTNDDIANLFRQKNNIINDLQVKPKKRKFSFFNKKE